MIGIVLSKILAMSPDGRYFKANYSLKNCDEEVIIFGSSRAELNYAPFVFEDATNMNCWNTGRGGQGLPFWYSMELGILSRYTPKIAIINIERDFLSQDLQGSYEHSGFLRPFYNDHPEIRTVIDKISAFESILMLSNLYAFNSSFYYLLRPFVFEGLDGRKEAKGWKTNTQIMTSNYKEVQVVNNNFELNSETLELFELFIKNLTNKGCKVFIVSSPNYGIIVESTSTFEYIQSMNNVNFINKSKDTLYSVNSEYYMDSDHLNTKGAIKFSKEISENILISKEID